MCSCKGQQTLGEEVSERIMSRVLKLEKENQSLLRTIEELRAASTSSSANVVCTTNNCTSSIDKSTAFQHSPDVFPQCPVVTQQTLNGDSDFLKGIQDEILPGQNPDLIQEKGEQEHRDGTDHFKELMSESEDIEHNHNKPHCFVESRDHFHDSRSSVPCQDSNFTGLSTRSSSYASKHSERLEAKCRELDIVNQHLQTSLDSTGRFCRTLGPILFCTTDHFHVRNCFMD